MTHNSYLKHVQVQKELSIRPLMLHLLLQILTQGFNNEDWQISPFINANIHLSYNKQGLSMLYPGVVRFDLARISLVDKIGPKYRIEVNGESICHLTNNSVVSSKPPNASNGLSSIYKTISSSYKVCDLPNKGIGVCGNNLYRSKSWYLEPHSYNNNPFYKIIASDIEYYNDIKYCLTFDEDMDLVCMKRCIDDNFRQIWRIELHKTDHPDSESFFSPRKLQKGLNNLSMARSKDESSDVGYASLKSPVIPRKIENIDEIDSDDKSIQLSKSILESLFLDHLVDMQVRRSADSNAQILQKMRSKGVLNPLSIAKGARSGFFYVPFGPEAEDNGGSKELRLNYDPNQKKDVRDLSLDREKTPKSFTELGDGFKESPPSYLRKGSGLIAGSFSIVEHLKTQENEKCELKPDEGEIRCQVITTPYEKSTSSRNCGDRPSVAIDLVKAEIKPTGRIDSNPRKYKDTETKSPNLAVLNVNNSEEGCYITPETHTPDMKLNNTGNRLSERTLIQTENSQCDCQSIEIKRRLSGNGGDSDRSTSIYVRDMRNGDSFDLIVQTHPSIHKDLSTEQLNELELYLKRNKIESFDKATEEQKKGALAFLNNRLLMKRFLAEKLGKSFQISDPQPNIVNSGSELELSNVSDDSIHSGGNIVSSSKSATLERSDNGHEDLSKKLSTGSVSARDNQLNGKASSDTAQNTYTKQGIAEDHIVLLETSRKNPGVLRNTLSIIKKSDVGVSKEPIIKNESLNTDFQEYVPLKNQLREVLKVRKSVLAQKPDELRIFKTENRDKFIRDKKLSSKEFQGVHGGHLCDKNGHGIDPVPILAQDGNIGALVVATLTSNTPNELKLKKARIKHGIIASYKPIVQTSLASIARNGPIPVISCVKENSKPLIPIYKKRNERHSSYDVRRDDKIPPLFSDLQSGQQQNVSQCEKILQKIPTAKLKETGDISAAIKQGASDGRLVVKIPRKTQKRSPILIHPKTGEKVSSFESNSVGKRGPDTGSKPIGHGSTGTFYEISNRKPRAIIYRKSGPTRPLVINRGQDEYSLITNRNIGETKERVHTSHRMGLKCPFSIRQRKEVKPAPLMHSKVPSNKQPTILLEPTVTKPPIFMKESVLSEKLAQTTPITINECVSPQMTIHKTGQLHGNQLSI